MLLILQFGGIFCVSRSACATTGKFQTLVTLSTIIQISQTLFYFAEISIILNQ